MKIIFTPQYNPGAPRPELSVEGDVLTIDGEELDFGPLEEGEAISGLDVGHPMFSHYDPVRRVNGVVEMVLVLPVSETKAIVTAEVASGPVEVPK